MTAALSLRALLRAALRTQVRALAFSCAALAAPSALAQGSALLSYAKASTQPAYISALGEPTLDRIKRTGRITLAHRESSIPFSYYDDDKRPVGYAVDLCNRLADAVKKHLKLSKLEVKYVAVTSANRIPAILKGEADLECGSTTNNAERRQQVAFTVPHYIAGARFLVRSDSAIRDADDLQGKTVITTRGTTTLALVKQFNQNRGLKMVVSEATDHQAAFAALESGAADAFVMDDILLAGLRANSRHPASTKLIGKFLAIEPYAIMMRKDDPEFKAVIDAEMTRMVLDAEVEGLYKKWFQAPIPPRGINLSMPMNYLLRDSFKYPTDRVADYLVMM